MIVPPVFNASFWIAIALTAAFSFGSGFTVRGWKAKADESAHIKQDAERERQEQEAWVGRVNIASKSASDYERYRAHASIRRQEAATRIDVVVERPSYRAVCIDDDGLRELRAVIEQADPDSAKPAGTVPRPSDAPGRDRPGSAQDDGRVGPAIPGLPGASPAAGEGGDGSSDSMTSGTSDQGDHS